MFCGVRSEEEGASISPGQSVTVINKEGKTKVLSFQFLPILKLPLGLKSSGPCKHLVCGSSGGAAEWSCLVAGD